MDANSKRSVRKHLSRVKIEEEIGGMIKNIVVPAGYTDAEQMLLVDGYAHMDILFEKYVVFLKHQGENKTVVLFGLRPHEG
jgi:hypothetical protein